MGVCAISSSENKYHLEAFRTVLILSYIFVTGAFIDENRAKGVRPHVAIQAAPQEWLFEAGGGQLT
jgi:hypothetical protein